jgi:hypothetical protein
MMHTCACFAWWWVEMKVGGLGSNRIHTHVCVYIHTVMKKGETRKGATSEKMSSHLRREAYIPRNSFQMIL